MVTRLDCSIDDHRKLARPVEHVLRHKAQLPPWHDLLPQQQHVYFLLRYRLGIELGHRHSDPTGCAPKTLVLVKYASLRNDVTYPRDELTPRQLLA
jgi:hypothetical protein